MTGWFGVLVYVLLFAILVYEIVMFVHVIRNDELTTKRKVLWVVGMILVHPIVAIVYNFTDYRRAGPSGV